MRRLTGLRTPFARSTLRLEQLEDRWTPASIQLSGSTLTISNPRIIMPNTKLEVIQQADGRFQVKDNSQSVGTYSASNIVINGSNFHDNISVTLAAGKSLTGNLTINGLNGNDDIFVNGNGTGEIRGNLFIDGGNGDDEIRVANATGLTIRGTTTLAAGLGNDLAQVAFGGTTTLYGDIGFYGFNTANYSIANTTFNGGFVWSHRISPSSSFVKIISGGLGTGAVTIPGTVKFELGAGNDTLNVNATSVGALIIDMGAGNNLLFLNTTVLRNTSVTFGTGDATVSIAAASVFNSSKVAGQGLSLTLGDGVHSLGGMNTAFTVNGNLTINATTGTNNHTIGVSATVAKTSGASTDGNLTINTGGGNDTVTIAGAVAGNIAASLGEGNNSFTTTGASSFSNLTFSAGDGNNTVNIAVPNPAGTHNLTLTFGGGGTNNVTLSGGASGGGTVTINWTDGVVDDTLTNGLGGGYTIVETGVR